MKFIMNSEGSPNGTALARTVAWSRAESAERFTRQPITAAIIGALEVVVLHQSDAFGVFSGVCNHAGGPLAEGRLDSEALEEAAELNAETPTIRLAEL